MVNTKNKIKFHLFEKLVNNDNFESIGNGLMDEKEFRQWIQRIQTLQEDPTSPSTSQTDTDDDITQDLIAAFRYAISLLSPCPLHMHLLLLPFTRAFFQFHTMICILFLHHNHEIIWKRV